MKQEEFEKCMDRLCETGEMSKEKGTACLKYLFQTRLNDIIIDSDTFYFEDDYDTHIDFTVKDERLVLIEPRISYWETDEQDEPEIIDIEVDESFDEFFKTIEAEVVKKLVVCCEAEINKYGKEDNKTCQYIAKIYKDIKKDLNKISKPEKGLEKE